MQTSAQSLEGAKPLQAPWQLASATSREGCLPTDSLIRAEICQMACWWLVVPLPAASFILPEPKPWTPEATGLRGRSTTPSKSPTRCSLHVEATTKWPAARDGYNQDKREGQFPGLGDENSATNRFVGFAHCASLRFPGQMYGETMAPWSSRPTHRVGQQKPQSQPTGYPLDLVPQ